MDEREKELIRMDMDELISGGLPDAIDVPTDPVLPKKPETNKYVELQTKSKRKATSAITSMLQLYLSQKIIEKEEYVRAKLELDRLSLSKLIFLMETSELSITRLMNEIDSGDVQPRMFEVLAGLQRTMLEIIRSQTMFLVAVEENAKKLSRDIEMYSGNPTEEKVSKKTDDGLVVRGMKELIKTIKETDVEDVDPVEK